MSILLVVIAALMLSAPLMTEGVWRALYQRESAQITLDNEGVRLGRSLRALLRLHRSLEASLELLEKEHHRFHLCGLECAVADRVWEAKLEVFSHESERALRAGWAEVLMHVSMRVHNLSREFPFEKRLCESCGGSWGWRWRTKALPLFLSLSDVTASPAYLCVSDSPPEYWMFAEEYRAREYCR